MNTSIEIPIGAVIISIFIGYMYHYLKSKDYKDVISLKSVIVGIISGFLISITVIIISLINTQLWDISGLLTSSILVIFGIIFSIGFVVIGGFMAILIKKVLSKIFSN
ncbi:MAG TPA: hypothetical protein VLN45_01215 [Ignavibacteriaceae bacterium]|nr:hypothetical protein [Ignavibacteriaceae bacterium]